MLEDLVELSKFLHRRFVKGAAPQPTQIFGGVAKDHISESREAMSKQAPV